MTAVLLLAQIVKTALKAIKHNFGSVCHISFGLNEVFIRNIFPFNKYYV